MADVLFLISGLGFFALLAGYAISCGRL